MKLRIKNVEAECITIEWDQVAEAVNYSIYWKDCADTDVQSRLLQQTQKCEYTLHKAAHVPHYLQVSCMDGKESSDWIQTPVVKVFREQLEQLNRGLIAIKVQNGVFLSWRLFLDEVSGYSKTGMTGTDFVLYRNKEKLAVVTDSTNYLDPSGNAGDEYAVAALSDSVQLQSCSCVKVWDKEYLEIPMHKPEGGMTPAGEAYEYHINDMSVGDVDGDGEYEYLIKWDPSNSHDVSIRGYTGNCYLDCCRLDGTLLWRLDMGVNIRAGAHYTQFMVYDFNGDGKAEVAVKTAAGTRIMRYDGEGRERKWQYITLPAPDLAAGYGHANNYVCSAQDYRQHLADVFMRWHERTEVIGKQWPQTLEECWGIAGRYSYPLCSEDALALADYFIQVYAPGKDPKNRLDLFEGFIYQGPEYLTMFSGEGQELETVAFDIDRVDDGLLWGDYAMPRIEPCNRVDRFLSGVAYLDGERPYLVICRGYYTRSVITAYDFFENRFQKKFCADSGFVPMSNPFNDFWVHGRTGSDPVYGLLAGQGNHSLAAADVDGDGYMEIIYGAAVIDHDGSLLYSSYDYRKDGLWTKLGHGDAMHVAKIDPKRPGLQIFNVFEGADAVPYGFALRDAQTGEVIFGEPASEDLGRCMVGRVDLSVTGLQVWVNDMYDCRGNRLDIPLLGTNAAIRWSADLTTQILDRVEYIGTVQTGVVNDNLHGTMLDPWDTLTNNGTKGNPCLVADLFGDFREELILRRADDNAVRIYMNTDVTKHKLFTLMHDTMYRCGVAWQNNCYNQPGYTKFYYADDMDFAQVIPGLVERLVILNGEKGGDKT